MDFIHKLAVESVEFLHDLHHSRRIDQTPAPFSIVFFGSTDNGLYRMSRRIRRPRMPALEFGQPIHDTEGRRRRETG